MTTPSESFLQACGAVGPLCVEIANRTTRRVIHQKLDQPFVVIGRDKHADIVLDDPDAGWRRAYVQVIDRHLFAMDLRAPIMGAERKELSMPCWLSPGQSLAFGPFDVTVSLGDQSVPQVQSSPASDAIPLSSRYAEREPLHNATLIFQNKVKRDLIWTMDRVLAILGQSSDCKIHLKSSSVSNFHCGLVRTRSGVWVLDLLGRGGISVNGSPVRCTRLADGDVLKVGDYFIELRCSPPGADARSRGQLPALRDSSGARGGERPGARSKLPGVPVAAAPSSGELPIGQIAAEKLGPPGTTQAAGTWPTEVLGSSDLASKALFEQFGLMQQQMVEQFDRVVSMMCQMFTALHREQSSQVREELEQIRRLTQELTTLKAEQVALNAGQSAPSDPAILAMPQRQGPDTPWPAAKLAEPDQGQPSGPTHETVAFEEVNRPEPRSVGGSSSDSTVAAAQAVPPTDASQARDRASAHAADDIHLRLSRRIAEIQQEQRGRLQRLLGMVTGR